MQIISLNSDFEPSFEDKDEIRDGLFDENENENENENKNENKNENEAQNKKDDDIGINSDIDEANVNITPDVYDDGHHDALTEDYNASDVSDASDTSDISCIESININVMGGLPNRAIKLKSNGAKKGDSYEESVVQCLLNNNSGLFETLLEILDGYNFIPGAIVIITTNYLEKIDTALIRPGRIDQKFLFENVTLFTVIEIFKFFYELPEDHPIINRIKNAYLNLTPIHNQPIHNHSSISNLNSAQLISNLSSAQLINTIILPNLDNAEDAVKLLCG